ncbi:MAG: hypothetical protein GEV09_12670 [Pseudonocardiaceae bacterium]|nr:hypothetical protein [Pseudonocardiaceae bacterium]
MTVDDTDLALALAALSSVERDELHESCELDAIAAVTAGGVDELAPLWWACRELVGAVTAADGMVEGRDPGAYVTAALQACPPATRRILVMLSVTRRDHGAGAVADWWASLCAHVAAVDAEQRQQFEELADDVMGVPR